MQTFMGRDETTKDRVKAIANAGNTRELLHFYRNHSPYELKLSFIVSNDSVDATRFTRNPVLVEWFRKRRHETHDAAKGRSKHRR